MQGATQLEVYRETRKVAAHSQHVKAYTHMHGGNGRALMGGGGASKYAPTHQASSDLALPICSTAGVGVDGDGIGWRWGRGGGWGSMHTHGAFRGGGRGTCTTHHGSSDVAFSITAAQLACVLVGMGLRGGKGGGAVMWQFALA